MKLSTLTFQAARITLAGLLGSGSAFAADAPKVYAADPPVVVAPRLKEGDAWTFDRSIERGTGGFTQQRFDYKVEHVGSDTMVVGMKLHGSPVDYEDHITGSDWSQRRVVEGKPMVTGQPFSFPLEIGKTWTIDWTDPRQIGLQTLATHHAVYKVSGWEDVTTTAGTFHALKVESDDKVKVDFKGATAAVGGTFATTGGSTAVVQSGKSGPHSVYVENFFSAYYAPQVKYWVKSVEDQFNSDEVRTFRQTDVLVSFTPAS